MNIYDFSVGWARNPKNLESILRLENSFVFLLDDQILWVVFLLIYLSKL